jgi:Domain of unknown function (DUF4389)
MGVAAAPPAGMSATAYPADVTYAQGGLERNRVTCFFRYILAIPNLVMLSIWGIGFEVTTFLAWWAILFTGRYPDGMYSFGVSYMRMAADSFAYLHLVTDEYPPWSGNDSKATSYPVQYSVVRPDTHSRMTVFFRLILAIPAFIFGYVAYLCAAVAAFIAWWAILFTGKYPEGLLSFVQGALRSYMRITTYAFFMRDEYPPFSLS